MLAELFLQRGLPKHIRSDNGPEFVSKKIQKYLQFAKVGTLYVKKGSPWENGYVESFNNIQRAELLNAEIFLDLRDARAHARRWRNKYNHHHPHSSLGYVPPAKISLSCLTPDTNIGIGPYNGGRSLAFTSSLSIGDLYRVYFCLCNTTTHKMAYSSKESWAVRSLFFS